MVGRQILIARRRDHMTDEEIAERTKATTTRLLERMDRMEATLVNEFRESTARMEAFRRALAESVQRQDHRNTG